jgi:hypothetical protein
MARASTTIAADLRMAAPFLQGLPGFLRRPLTQEAARSVLRGRLARREADFLTLVQRAVYEWPPSPYRRLLAHAGCEHGDLCRLVRADGVESALRTLLRAGVYLTLAELRGHRPVVRGALELAVDMAALANPLARRHVSAGSGGSLGPRAPIPVSLEAIRDGAVNYRLALEAHGALGCRHAIWSVPGGAALGQILRFSVFGAVPERWFSQIDPAAAGLHARYRWSDRLMRWTARLAGVRLPPPTPAPVGAPEPVLRWITDVFRRGETPHILTFASSAVRLAVAAARSGVDVAGTRITLGGEPITAARLEAVRASGMRPLAHYGSSEGGGTLAYGCAAPAAPDDLHWFHDLRAVIQPGAAIADSVDGRASRLSPRELLVSTLRDTAPLILLNASLGDQAVVEERACGCPLEGLGWGTHVHAIRSEEKLTAGGMNLLDADVVRVLDEVLPARFGGAPTDYQLVEYQDGSHARLRLVVDPSVGPLDAGAVARALVDALGAQTGAADVAARLWQEGGYLEVERRAIQTTAGGKIAHVHRAAAGAGRVAQRAG